MPQKMRVSNQREYNEFLKKEEMFFILFIENWYENSPKVAGGNNTYNPNYGLNKEIKVQLRRGKQGKLEYFSNN